MKNDHSFKLVAAIIVAGVISALVGPSPVASTLATSTDSAPAVHAAE